MANSDAVWLHDWALGSSDPAVGGQAAMLSDFDIKADALDGLTVLLGSYGTYSGYDGDAFVLLRRDADGALLRVDGAHCSCYGLEGQWEPEETTVAALRLALAGGSLGADGDSPFAAELTALLDELDPPTVAGPVTA